MNQRSNYYNFWYPSRPLVLLEGKNIKQRKEVGCQTKNLSSGIYVDGWINTFHIFAEIEKILNGSQTFKHHCYCYCTPILYIFSSLGVI